MREELETDHMGERLTIGELASAAGVPTSTVRYYERAEVLSAEGRTAGNYRYYTADSLSRLRFIRAALAGGFAIEDVRTLLRVRDCRNPSKRVQELLRNRLSEVAQRMKELRRVRRELESSLARCQGAEDTHCEVISKLSASRGGQASHGRSKKRGRKST